MRATSQISLISVVDWATMPLHERVLDRLADMLFEVDDLLEMLNEGICSPDMRSIQPDIEQVYETVDALMRRLSD